MSLGAETIEPDEEDEGDAAAPTPLSIAAFEVARAAEALRRGIPLCTGALAFIASAGCSVQLLE